MVTLPEMIFLKLWLNNSNENDSLSLFYSPRYFIHRQLDKLIRLGKQKQKSEKLPLKTLFKK
ncbi:hypothetical protein OB69_00625 [Roseivirga seohaensis subsp. aquiponti]|uniref:Uncharacterized protein n=1 Tax=Roseivirga seohaensis subsp. aquiponti TaxID=1566026 RepID=A0A0L8AQ79_9BACT|nr:hypothetical protein OB69_00625 [Roseivirga seohaensis subsp. aquiponti]